MKRKTNRILALFCAIMLMVVTAVPVYAETAAEKYNRLKKELNGINQQIDTLKDNKASAEQQKASYQQQKAVVEEMIATKQAAIAETQTALDAKGEEVAKKREVIYENEELFNQRLIAMYKMNDANAISTILNVNSFSDLLTVADSLQRISIHDTDLIALLNQQRTELETEEAEINNMLAQLEADYADLENDKNTLANNIVAQDAKISAAEADMQASEQAYSATYAELEQAQREMAAEAAKINSQGSNSGDGSQYVGGVFTWPVPASTRITCYFGSPDPNGAAHRGMDIGAPTGTSIVAAGDGVVLMTVPGHRSYGNYVVVDHGAGVKSLYAHCNSLDVAAGTPVTKGTHIATVGSTGFSTGPHLHFEVQVDGGLRNPLNYLSA